MIEKFETRYMLFELIERKHKTGVWEIVNRKDGDRLGIIKWFPHWRRYCLFLNGITFSVESLRDIAAFIDKVTVERQLKKEQLKIE